MGPRLLRLCKQIVTSSYFTPLALLFMALLLFPLRGVGISPDASWYLNKGLSIYKDFGPSALIVCRPVFPFFIAVSFYLFGVSVQSAFLVVRSFYVLNIVLCYFLGEKLFNKATGLVFSLLVLTSFVINRWSSFLLLDNILPFFVLLYILLTYLAMDRAKYRHFALSGIILGISLLVKGVTAVMFTPLPICLLIFKEFRSARNLKGMALIYLLFAIVISPWLYKIVSGQARPTILLGALADTDLIKSAEVAPETKDVSGKSLLWEALSKDKARLVSFARNYIRRDFILWRLFIAGFFYCIFKSIVFKNKASGAILISTMLLGPIIYVVAKLNYRTGQVILLYFLLYLMLSDFLVSLFACGRKFFVTKPKLHRLAVLAMQTASVSAILVCAILQTFVGKRGKNRDLYGLMTNPKVQNARGFTFWKKTEFETEGWAGQATQEAAEWIKDNVPVNSPLMCQWGYREAIRFFTEDDYTLHEIREIHLSPDTVQEVSAEKPVFIWPLCVPEQIAGNHFVVQSEDTLLRQINKTQSKYVIVTYRRNFLSLYMRNNPDFSLVKSVSDGKIKIYRVEQFPVTPRKDFSCKFTNNVYDYLRHLQRKDSLKYKQEKGLLSQILPWSKIRIDEFFSFIEKGNAEGFREKYEEVEERKIYQE